MAKFPLVYDSNCPIVLFTPFEYKFPYASAKDAPLELTKGHPDFPESVSLYLPGGFQEAAGSTWDFQDVIGGDQSGFASSLGAEMAAGLKTFAGGKITSSISAKVGQILAPMDVLVYAGPSPIELNFSFQMMPITSSESNEVTKISRMFKKVHAPRRNGKDALTLLYPPIFTVTFANVSGMGYGETQSYTWMACTKSDVSYTGDTNMHVYNSDKRPIQTNLNLSFKCVKKFVER
jgi:hypothetical protein